MRISEVSGNGDESCETLPHQTVVKAGVRTNRCFSHRSEEALSALLLSETRLAHIEDRVAEIDTFVRGLGPQPVGLSKAKSDLAQLEADANKLESTGVDNIYTSELQSGQASAKENKKEQLRRLEALFSRIDGVFGVISTGAVPSSQAAVVQASQPPTAPHTPQLAAEDC